MITEYTISTAAEEPDASSKNSDQNFEESSSKNMNSEDPTFPVDQDNDKTLGDIHIISKSKKKTQYKHILHNHDLCSIIPGKRTRKTAEGTSEAEKPILVQPPTNLKKGLGEMQQKGGMVLRNSTKMQPRPKGKVDRRLNKIFGKGPNYEEVTESFVDTSEVFENLFQRLKKKEDVVLNDFDVKAIPEKRRVIEVLVPHLDKNEKEIIKILPNNEKEQDDRSFLINRNLLQKTRDFLNIKELNIQIQNFPKAQPYITNPQLQQDKLEELRKKLEEFPDIPVKKVEKQVNKLELMTKNGRNMSLNQNPKHSHTYINCDLRYLNFDFLVEKLGYFDVILMDPPWRIEEPRQNDEVSTNNKTAPEYNTMSNQEILNLRIDKISKKGFIFMWILSDQLNLAYEMLNKWGYEVVDQIIWVKLQGSKVLLSQGYYFMHSFEMCLLGYKCPPGEYVEYNSKVSNNIIFAEARKKAQKPEELYEIIDLMMPGAKKVELFARNHNLRSGWFSLGNQLGEEFDKWINSIGCNQCNQSIPIGVKRYKARYQPNYDLCETCFQTLGLDKDEFFVMNNSVSEDILHHYHCCSHCHAEPIWGTRFTCLDCENFDLCEACFDTILQSDIKLHDIRHNFQAIEVPLPALVLPSHSDKKCVFCLQHPIVGVCFSCSQCPNLNFCQNCYFSKSMEEMKKIKNHKPFHNVSISTEPVEQEIKAFKCIWCETYPIEGTVYKCEGCFNFYFCEKCYFKRDGFKVTNARSHKFYHKFSSLTVD